MTDENSRPARGFNHRPCVAFGNRPDPGMNYLDYLGNGS
jgi:hypothetical protein